jgi:hypothetical protein
MRGTSTGYDVVEITKKLGEVVYAGRNNRDRYEDTDYDTTFASEYE